MFLWIKYMDSDLDLLIPYILHLHYVLSSDFLQPNL